VRNICEDMSQTYYVKVERVSASVTSCAGYELSVTNNGGVCDTTTECPF
jgi:nickel-dependent lactate racemase